MRNVFKLSTKGIGVILPVIFVYIYTWMNPLGYMDEEAPYYMWNKEQANTRQEKDYRVIILGDSTANASYAPEILSDDTINLSLGGTTPVENYYILDDWLAHNNAPDVCYISFMDHHLYEEDCFWRRIVYSHRFRIGQIVEILKAAKEYNEDSIICENYKTDFISYELRLPNKYITSLMNAGFNQRYAENIEAWKQNDLHRGRYIGRTIQEGDIPDGIVYDEFCVSPLFDDYLKKLINLCEDKDIQVRIVKIPLPGKEKYTQEYTEGFHSYYKAIKKSFPGITVDWFSAYEEDKFVDSSHMNSHGALKFSKELKMLYSEDF